MTGEENVTLSRDQNERRGASHLHKLHQSALVTGVEIFFFFLLYLRTSGYLKE